MNEAMIQLRKLQKQLYGLKYAMNVIEYDDATVAPSESSEGRGDALEQLSGLQYGLMADPALPGLFEAARTGNTSEQELAEIDELEREYRRISCIPADEYAAFSKLTSTAGNIWHKAKAANDFSMFAPYLEKIVDACRRFAGLLDNTRAPYDVWLDQYEPGLNMAQCDIFFNQLKATIQPLVKRIVTEGKAPRTDFLEGNWDIDQQKKLSPRIMALMGIDPTHCQLGETEHPFTTEFYKGDVRITTHYYADNMVSNMYSVIHEGGHALYELHIADRLVGTCLASGVSMGIHESQSRFFENNIGRSLPFLTALWPTLTELFPEHLNDVSVGEFYKAVNTCQPSLIRTEADEVTYCLHIMVRYELERQLMDGTLSVCDLPSAWNRLMKELLGVDVPCDAKGVLQDVHWSGGELGYFPSYALGTAYAAQYMAAMKKDLDVDALLAAGNLSPISEWLEKRIWQYGTEKKPAWLIRNATGMDFDPHFYTDYLVEKFSKIYELN